MCPQRRVKQVSEDELLFRSFQGILNKITPQSFQVLAEKALWLDINTEKRLIGCTDKILKTVSANNIIYMTPLHCFCGYHQLNPYTHI